MDLKWISMQILWQEKGIIIWNMIADGGKALAMKHFTRTIGAAPEAQKATAFADLLREKAINDSVTTIAISLTQYSCFSSKR